MTDLPKPITITLYDASDEPVKTCSRSRVPAEILLRAMELSEGLEASGIDLDHLPQGASAAKEVRGLFETLGAFVVDVFDGQFNLGELLKGAELNDIVAVVFAVANKAGAVA